MKQIVFDFENMGGVSHVYAIPPSSYAGMRMDYATGRKHLQLTRTGEVIDIPVFADGTYYFNENQTRSDAGEGYAVEIGGIIPKHQECNAGTVELLERGEWLVLCSDMNGSVRLAGVGGVRLKFTTQKSTGTGAADRNQISFVFACTQENPSVFVSVEDISRL